MKINFDKFEFYINILKKIFKLIYLIKDFMVI